MAYRRLVAEALAALDEEASGRVVELGSRGSAPPAEPRGWRCADVGGWIRKHRAHLPESDAWDWYERVRRAINKLACDGAVHMYAVDRFRLVVPVADVTYALRVRCEDGETIPLIVPRSCDDRRLRALISRATGGRVPPERVEVEYPRRAPAPASAARASDALVESRGLRDGDEIRVRVVKSQTAVARAPSGPDAAPRDDVVDLVSDEEAPSPAARVARTTDPDRSPDAASAHEVIELEAEGEDGWNDDRDGWVNLVAGDETRDDHHRRGPPEQKTLPGDTNTTAAVEGGSNAAPPNAAPPNAAPEVVPRGRPEGGRRRGALETFASDDEADDAAALDPTSSVFSPSAAFVANPRVVALESESESSKGSKGLRFSGGASTSDPDGSSSALTGSETASDVEALTGSETASDVEASSDLEAASPAGRLHAQVRRFAASAGVSPEDAADRDATVRTIRESVARVYPSARVEVFGSGATGLALREADIDLVVLGVGPEASARGGGFDRSDRGELVRVLRRVEKQLRKDRVVRSACGIYTAKVPIIKACAGAYDVDISVGVTNGLDAVAWIRRQAEGFHALQASGVVSQAASQDARARRREHGGVRRVPAREPGRQPPQAERRADEGNDEGNDGRSRSRCRPVDLLLRVSPRVSVSVPRGASVGFSASVRGRLRLPARRRRGEPRRGDVLGEPPRRPPGALRPETVRPRGGPAGGGPEHHRERVQVQAGQSALQGGEGRDARRGGGPLVRPGTRRDPRRNPRERRRPRERPRRRTRRARDRERERRRERRERSRVAAADGGRRRRRGGRIFTAGGRGQGWRQGEKGRREEKPGGAGERGGGGGGQAQARVPRVRVQ
jgi:hypothetical protein